MLKLASHNYQHSKICLCLFCGGGGVCFVFETESYVAQQVPVLCLSLLSTRVTDITTTNNPANYMFFSQLFEVSLTAGMVPACIPAFHWKSLDSRHPACCQCSSLLISLCTALSLSNKRTSPCTVLVACLFHLQEKTPPDHI